MSAATKYLRHAIRPEQGVGFYELPATAFPMPETSSSLVLILDEEKNMRGIIMDGATGKWYDLTTRDGPPGAVWLKTWTGKAGEEFDRYFVLPEDLGTEEKDFIRLLAAHLQTRAYKDANIGDGDYDANGYPLDIEFTIEWYVDGATVKTTQAADVARYANIKPDKKIEGHRVSAKITANRGEHLIVSRLFEYAASRRAAAPDNRISTEMVYQEALASNLTFWLSPIDDVVYNRVTGNQVPVASFNPTIVAGVSGIAGIGMRFSGSSVVGTCAAGTAYVLFWSDEVVTVRLNGTSVTLTAIYTIGDWSLYYGSAVAGASGGIQLTASVASTVCDFRMMSAAPSTGARAYYYDDIEANNGEIVLP